MYPSYDSIKYFYDINAYSNEDIMVYVELGILTYEQYESITGESFPQGTD